jgi:hypothetical protein
LARSSATAGGSPENSTIWLQWIAVNGELVNPASGSCLDDPAFNTAEGTQLDLWTCNGGAN